MLSRTEVVSFWLSRLGYLGAVPIDKARDRRAAMRTYERPTLTRAGSFKQITGLGGSGPRDVLGRHQSL